LNRIRFSELSDAARYDLWPLTKHTILILRQPVTKSAKASWKEAQHDGHEEIAQHEQLRVCARRCFRGENKKLRTV